MMSHALEILALEPYCGGLRRDMLRTLSRCSRHRWRVMTLAPRSMARRITTSAHWFAGQLAGQTAHQPGAPLPDVVFATDALNLADLHRLQPRLLDRPSVVYFHCNDLPDPAGPIPVDCFDLPHLRSARAATEIWFNSANHAGSFMSAVDSLFDRFDASRNPASELRAKMHTVPPPIEEDDAVPEFTDRCLDTIHVELGGVNLDLLASGLEILGQSSLKWKLITAGDADLPVSVPRQVISHDDPHARAVALQKASIFVSARIAAPMDDTAVRALRAGCQPVLPHTGIYPDLISESLHADCLYDMSPESLATHLRHALLVPRQYSPVALSARLGDYDVARACPRIDDRLDRLAARFGPAPRRLVSSLG
jgi:hypothetical protein